MAFFDIKVVSPYAKSYVSLSSEALYRKAEKAKEREYAERIRHVEHGDFNPMVFTTAGGMGKHCRLVFKRLATTLSEKRGLPNSVVSLAALSPKLCVATHYAAMRARHSCAKS